MRKEKKENILKLKKWISEKSNRVDNNQRSKSDNTLGKRL